MYDRILIPTDGSELADKAVDQGFALAKALGSKVTIVRVTNVPAAKDIQVLLQAVLTDSSGVFWS